MNYYEVLRISEKASLNEIKNAYKKLVKKYHPDIYEGNKLFAESKIKEINEAYETLSEKTKKAKYDAELNYKRYEPPKSDFVQTYSTSQINKYADFYNNLGRVNRKKNDKVRKKKKEFDFIAFGRKIFFKIDKKYKTEEKQNMIILILLVVILLLGIGILGFI